MSFKDFLTAEEFGVSPVTFSNLSEEKQEKFFSALGQTLGRDVNAETFETAISDLNNVSDEKLYAVYNFAKNDLTETERHKSLGARPAEWAQIESLENTKFTAAQAAAAPVAPPAPAPEAPGGATITATAPRPTEPETGGMEDPSFADMLAAQNEAERALGGSATTQDTPANPTNPSEPSAPTGAETSGEFAARRRTELASNSGDDSIDTLINPPKPVPPAAGSTLTLAQNDAINDIITGAGAEDDITPPTGGTTEPVVNPPKPREDAEPTTPQKPKEDAPAEAPEPEAIAKPITRGTSSVAEISQELINTLGNKKIDEKALFEALGFEVEEDKEYSINGDVEKELKDALVSKNPDRIKAAAQTAWDSKETYDADVAELRNLARDFRDRNNDNDRSGTERMVEIAENHGLNLEKVNEWLANKDVSFVRSEMATLARSLSKQISEGKEFSEEDSAAISASMIRNLKPGSRDKE